MKTCSLFLFACLLLAIPALGQTSATSNQNAELIPQNLLRLVHAPEVHQELAFTAEQVKRLEAFFDLYDGPWFRSRILPADKQLSIVAELEVKLRGWLAKNASAEQTQRLQQLEYRSQGVRMLLREDLGKQLGLKSTQVQELAKLATASNTATANFQKANMGGEVSEKIKSAVVSTAKAEQSALNTILSPEQQQKLKLALGEAFDTAKLERIYPMAPELVYAADWINSEPQKLKDLRGKVVIVHFYAFQCHNCHANFGHYNKWQSEFPSDKVALIGIQTPETSSEREPTAVREAAKERGFQFPVLIDLKSENWKAWSNTMWPTVYVIDKKGYIRYVWQGELNWNGATQDQTIHDLIEKLIAEDETV